MTNRYLQPAELLAMFPGDATAQALGVTRNADGTFTPSDPATRDARISAFIAQAEDFTDAYISAKYTLPLKSVPPVLKPIVADLARHRIYSDKTTEAIKQRYEEAIHLLGKIANSKILLGVPNQESAVAANNDLPLFSNSRGPRMFGPGQLDDFMTTIYGQS